MNVRWSPQSLQFYEDILVALIAYSARAAERFSDRVIAASQRISTFPESGRLIPEFGDPQLRQVVVDRYRLWYRLSEGERWSLSARRGSS